MLAAGTRVAVKGLKLAVAAGAGAAELPMSEQMRTGVEALSQSPARQHRAAAGMEQGWHGALLRLRLDGGCLVDHLACRCSGAFVPLTANERILVLSDVARALAYEAFVGQAPQLPAPVRVIQRDVKSANVLLGEAAVAVLVTLVSLNPSTTTSPRICRQSTSWAHMCTWRPSI